MGDIAKFPVKPEHLIARFDAVIAEFDGRTGNKFTPEMLERELKQREWFYRMLLECRQ